MGALLRSCSYTGQLLILLQATVTTTPADLVYSVTWMHGCDWHPAKCILLVLQHAGIVVLQVVASIGQLQCCFDQALRDVLVYLLTPPR